MMNIVKIKRNTDCKINFSIFDHVQYRRSIDISHFKNIVFEVFDVASDAPLIQKSYSNNGAIPSHNYDNRNRPIYNKVTVFIKSEDTLRFSANSHIKDSHRIYTLTGVGAQGRTILSEGFFYSEPSAGGANVLH